MIDARKALQDAREAATQAVMAIADSAPYPDIGEPDADELADAAIDAFLSKLSETHAIVPRDATDEMHRAGMNERQMQDNQNRAFGFIVDTSRVWSAMIEASQGDKG